MLACLCDMSFCPVSRKFCDRDSSSTISQTSQAMAAMAAMKNTVDFVGLGVGIPPRLSHPGQPQDSSRSGSWFRKLGERPLLNLMQNNLLKKKDKVC